MPKGKNQIMRDYRAKAAKRGLVQVCVMVPMAQRGRLNTYATKLRREFEKINKTQQENK